MSRLSYCSGFHSQYNAFQKCSRNQCFCWTYVLGSIVMSLCDWPSFLLVFLLPHGATALNGLGTPLDRRRDFYQTTHNTHKRQTLIPRAGFQPAPPASETPQTHALDRAVAWFGYHRPPTLVYVKSWLFLCGCRALCFNSDSLYYWHVAGSTRSVTP